MIMNYPLYPSRNPLTLLIYSKMLVDFYNFEERLAVTSFPYAK